MALVIGAGTGIGESIAKMFAEEGAPVVITARRERPLQETCKLAPQAISYVQMDLTSNEDRARALQTVIDRHGKLDVLVSNPGMQLWKFFDETTNEEIDDIYMMNLAATPRFFKQTLPHLEVSKGNIVIISSTAARYTVVPSQQLSVYGVSKAGLNHRA